MTVPRVQNEQDPYFVSVNNTEQCAREMQRYRQVAGIHTKGDYYKILEIKKYGCV
jgi:hypothetical protein